MPSNDPKWTATTPLHEKVRGCVILELATLGWREVYTQHWTTMELLHFIEGLRLDAWYKECQETSRKYWDAQQQGGVSTHTQGTRKYVPTRSHNAKAPRPGNGPAERSEVV